MKAKKLDKRNKGHGLFKYSVIFDYRETEKFLEVRNWCWSQWGPSSELDFYTQSSLNSEGWAWITDEWRKNIYLKSDKEYQWFILKWYA